MRPHVSINVADVAKSVEFYQRAFGVAPQKQTPHYAKFDLPTLNFTMQSGESRPVSQVNHLGMEVSSTAEVKEWETRLVASGILATPEEGTNCCFAKQDKVWFQDPDGNAWEIFVVHHQLPIGNPDGNIDSPFMKAKNPGKACC